MRINIGHSARKSGRRRFLQDLQRMHPIMRQIMLQRNRKALWLPMSDDSRKCMLWKVLRKFLEAARYTIRTSRAGENERKKNSQEQSVPLSY